MIDARVYGLSDRFVTTNSFVDQTDLLQLYGGLSAHNFLGTGLHAEATFGRQTFDFGSRRLIAGGTSSGTRSTPSMGFT